MSDAGEHRVLAPNTLVLYVDESGDETFRDPQHPIFAFGGVACVSGELDLIGANWRAMKAAHFPQVKGALHATTNLKESKLKGAKREAILAATTFIGLARFGIVLTNRTVVPQDLVIAAITSSLTMRLEEIANKFAALGRWRPGGPVLMIFEASTRLESAIEGHLGQLSYEVDGQSYAIEGAFMPKRAADPLLEMADFIAYTIGINVKYQMAHDPRACTANFERLFRNVGNAPVSYMQAETVTFQSAAA